MKQVLLFPSLQCFFFFLEPSGIRISPCLGFMVDLELTQEYKPRKLTEVARPVLSWAAVHVVGGSHLPYNYQIKPTSEDSQTMTGEYTRLLANTYCVLYNRILNQHGKWRPLICIHGQLSLHYTVQGKQYNNINSMFTLTFQTQCDRSLVEVPLDVLHARKCWVRFLAGVVFSWGPPLGGCTSPRSR